MFRGKYALIHKTAVFALTACAICLAFILAGSPAKDIASVLEISGYVCATRLVIDGMLLYWIKQVALVEWPEETGKIVKLTGGRLETDTGRVYTSFFLELRKRYSLGEELKFRVNPKDNTWYYLCKQRRWGDDNK